MGKRLILALCIAMPLFGEEKNWLKTRGEFSVKVPATEGALYARIGVEGPTGEAVQQKLAVKTDKAMAFFKKQEGEVQTSEYRVYPVYQEKAPQLVAGYKGEVEIVFTASLDKLKLVIPKLPEGEVNQIQRLVLKASEEEINLAKAQALKGAAESAVASAKTALQSLQLEWVGIREVSVGNTYPVPLAKNRAVSFAVQSPESVDLQGEQEVSASMEITVEFKP